MTIEQHCITILKLLKENKNVLLLGPPGTGKSVIMAHVAEKFKGVDAPKLSADSVTPLTKGTRRLEEWMPSPARSGRNVFQITFHQGTKHRDFVSGIIPRLGPSEVGFTTHRGVLMTANDAATTGTSLILIDELNRGPAVTVFGDTLSAIEKDKRLAEDGTITPLSSSFYTFKKGGTELEPTHLSSHVYMLAAMNEADTSVEPLDVAFLRRFQPYRLYPDITVLHSYFGLSENEPLENQAETVSSVFGALIRAWMQVNTKLAMGKGDAFQIGHGVLMLDPVPTSVPQALTYALQAWQRVEAHVREVLYANDTAQAFVFNAAPSGQYALAEFTFADELVSRFKWPVLTEQNIYDALLQVLDEEQ